MSLVPAAERMLRDFERGDLRADEHDEIAARLWMVEREAAATPAREEPTGLREALVDIRNIADGLEGPLLDHYRREVVRIADAALDASRDTAEPEDDHFVEFERQSAIIRKLRASAVRPEAGLDVDRLARALGGIGVIDNGTWVSFSRRDAEVIAAAYARLAAAPADGEETPGRLDEWNHHVAANSDREQEAEL